MDVRKRLQRRRIKKKLPLFLIGLLSICFGLSFMVLAWGGHVKRNSVLRNGEYARALITSKDKDYARSTTEYFIRYRYKDNNNRTLEGRTGLPGQDWAVLKVGDPIQIAYDPNDPEWDVLVEYAAAHTIGTPILFSLFGVIGVAIGVILIVHFSRSLKTTSVLKNL